MAIPLVPLLAGAVIGSVLTYIYKDEKMRSSVVKTADDVSDKVKDLSEKAGEGVTSLRNRVAGRCDDGAVESAEPETAPAMADKDEVSHSEPMMEAVVAPDTEQPKTVLDPDSTVVEPTVDDAPTRLS